MSWNDAYERRKFKENQKKQAAEYRALGMTEEQIQAMYEFDLEQFRSDRRFYSHTQSLLPDTFDENEDNDEKLSIFELFKDVFTTTIEESEYKSRYWWVDEIGEDDLLYLASVDVLKRLFKQGIEKEVIDRLNLKNAEKMGCKVIPII